MVRRRMWNLGFKAPLPRRTSSVDGHAEPNRVRAARSEGADVDHHASIRDHHVVSVGGVRVVMAVDGNAVGHVGGVDRNVVLEHEGGGCAVTDVGHGGHIGEHLARRLGPLG